MPYRKSKYSTVQNQALSVTALDVLSESPIALSINDICVRRPSLQNQTTQKMARILNELVEMGLVQKTKSKSRGRMVYMATSQLESQGYNIKNQTIL